MYLERKYLSDLENWLNSERRKPLIVWGARQVGKSYLIKDIFAEKYFENSYIYIDCLENIDFVNFCQSNYDVSSIISYLSLKYNRRIDENTLLIFDEIQECTNLITMLKYFCQEYRNIPIIATGSMVRIKLKRDASKRGPKGKGFLFPVGKINELVIYPLNFKEYLLNRNKMLYEKIYKNYKEKIPLDDLSHELALNMVYEYLYIGGLPEVVETYLSTKSYYEARLVLKEIYNNYLNDMELYQASNESIRRTRRIFTNIYTELNKESKNFKASLIEKNLRIRDLKSPLDWLLFCHIVYKSSLIKEHITIPLGEYNESLFRLYLVDMGLFNYQSNLDPTTFLTNKINNLSGIFFENYVAIELKNIGKELFYWKSKEEAEFEFVITHLGKVIPIDVKKNRGSLKSLNKFKNINEYNYAIKISSQKYNYDEVNKIYNIPFYAVFLLCEDLKDF